MKKIIKWANGNPGALTFLLELIDNKNTAKAMVIIPKLKETSIRGTNLYILWSDLCDKDMDKVYYLCINCPVNILEDACSRQDYSGKELVKNYLEPANPQLN